MDLLATDLKLTVAKSLAEDDNDVVLKSQVMKSFLLFLSCSLVICSASSDVVDRIPGDDNGSKNQQDGHGSPTPLFGHNLLLKEEESGGEFLLEYTNFNHGSFGACPKRVLNYQSYLRLLQEQRPDPWMRNQYKELINETRRQIADYVKAPAVDDGDTGILLVESASTAVNSIMRSLQWHPGDIILYFSVTYGMVKNTAKWLEQQEGIEIVQVPVKFPIAAKNATRAFTDPLLKVLQQLKETSKIQRLRLAIIDHIASVPAVREPVSECAHMIKKFNSECFVLVDGAHAMGQVQNLNLHDLRPMDAYLSNGHKWLYSPKGSAFLWVNESVVTRLFPEPTVISSANTIGATSLSERYSYVSTRDYTATIAMSKALEFRNNVLGSDDAIYDYVHTLAMDAKAHLLTVWNATAIVPNSLEDFMINIELPKAIMSIAMGNALKAWLLDEHNIYMLALYDEGSDMFYTRLSSQVYLELSDFVRLGALVLDFTVLQGQHQIEQ